MKIENGQFTIEVGKDQCSMMDPPNEGTVLHNGRLCKIGRTGAGLICLRSNGECHPEFLEGMSMSQFVHWINGQLQ